MSIVGESLTDQDEVHANIERALLFDARGSAEATEENMFELQAAFRQSPELQHVAEFLFRYGGVTDDVNRRKAQGRFSRPDVIESAVVDFFHTHKDPVKEAVLDGRTDGLWAEFVHDYDMSNQPPAIQFFRGALIHIANGPDLPTVVANHGVPRSYFADYYVEVGNSLRKQGREYAKEYVDGHTITQEAVALTADVLIRAIRLRAWVDAYRIRAAMDEGDTTKVTDIQNKITERTRREIKLIVPLAGVAIRTAEWTDKKATTVGGKIAEVIRNRRLGMQASRVV
jgi:hypothetical protein